MRRVGVITIRQLSNLEYWLAQSSWHRRMCRCCTRICRNSIMVNPERHVCTVGILWKRTLFVLEPRHVIFNLVPPALVLEFCQSLGIRISPTEFQLAHLFLSSPH